MKQISPISPIIPRGTAGFTGPLSLLRSRGTARALRALGGGGVDTNVGWTSNS